MDWVRGAAYSLMMLVIAVVAGLLRLASTMIAVVAQRHGGVGVRDDGVRGTDEPSCYSHGLLFLLCMMWWRFHYLNLQCFSFRRPSSSCFDDSFFGWSMKVVSSTVVFFHQHRDTMVDR
jgi:hypothetical protein